MLIYQCVILAIIILLTLIASHNLLTLARLRDYQPAPRDAWPLISILVPARNEQRSIAACVHSLLAQDYPNFEIIVLDDNSNDATANIVQSLVATPAAAGRLRLIHGGPLLGGWLGKNNACRQLAEQANGDFLLFTDADTVHAATALSAAFAIAEQCPADLVTTWPHQEMHTWGERVVLPLLHFTVIAYLPLALTNGRSRNPAFGLGNGQYMLFRRSAYEAIGGHGAVRDKILEDVELGRTIKRLGFRLAVPDGSAEVSCRMYHTTAETFFGLAKSLYAFFLYSFPFAAFMLILQFALFVAPYLFLLWAIINPSLWNKPEWLLLPMLQILPMLAVRLAIAARTREQLRDCFWQPISFLFYFAATIYAIWSRYAKGGVTWKGRHYTKPN